MVAKMISYISSNTRSATAWLRILAYYVQRILVSRRFRYLAARATVAILTLIHGRSGLAKTPSHPLVGVIRKKGFVCLGQVLSSHQCIDILRYLRHKKMKAARGAGHKFTLGSVPPGTLMGDYSLDTIVNCPHVMELANRPDILALAAEYIGYVPTVTTMGIRWSFPSDDFDADVQGFHRDSELASVKLLVYLTDVDVESGPHDYVQGSHHDRMPIRLRRYSTREILDRYGTSTVVTGPSGTALAIDTKGIHRGLPPTRRARLLLSIQYSLLPCFIYEYVPVRYMGRAKLHPYINRLMVNESSSINVQPITEHEEFTAVRE